MRGLCVALLAAGGLALGSGRPAPAAAVDVNGLWRIAVYVTELSYSFTDTCAAIITQTGTEILLSGSCQGVIGQITIRGTFDPQTNQFTGRGSTAECPESIISGSVLVDSMSFTGEYSCPSLGLSGGINASRCGNGQVDPGESCDDGNRRDGDCCSSICIATPAGGACNDDGNACTSDTCSAVGVCQHANREARCSDNDPCTAADHCSAGACVGSPLAEGAECDDGNACTSGDTCREGACVAHPVTCPACLDCNVALGCVPTISNACKQSSAHALLLRRRDGDDVRWRFERGDSIEQAELGDPRTDTDYDFCIYDSAADANGTPRLVTGARAAAGVNWRAVPGGFAYHDGELDPQGLRSALVSRNRGQSRVRIKSVKSLPLPQLPSLVFPLTVQLQSSDGETCWSARYQHPAIMNPLGMRASFRAPVPDRRPNILVVSLDDTRVDGIDRMPRTLARLAGEGVSFQNAFVVNPLCAPSRASLLTGLYARHHGVRTLSPPIGGAGRLREMGTDRETIAVWLQSVGYMTGLFGKYINGYAFGASEQMSGPAGTVYVPPGWTRWRGMASPEHYGGQRGDTFTLIDEHGAEAIYDEHATDAQYSTDVLAGQVRTFVAEAVAAQRPFFAVWTPVASHAESGTFIPEPAARHFGVFRGMPGWRPPSWGEKDMSDKPPFMQALRNTFANIIYTDLIRIGAYESLLSVDEQLGVILEDLVRLGVDDNTVVILTSDNGVGWGEHRIFAQAKECQYEECLRVPLIVHDPRRGRDPVVREATALNIDVAPTVAALAGIAPPVPIDGVSLTPWLSGPPPTAWRSDFLIEHYRTDRIGRLTYRGQPTDGDQVRVLYGDALTQPRPSGVFEFDDGGGVSSGAVAVAIGADADATFANFAAAVMPALPAASGSPRVNNDTVVVTDDVTLETGSAWLTVERDQGDVMTSTFLGVDFLGVRDVAGGFTYIEHESGDRELYDLASDPAQLESKVADPAYDATRARLAARLQQLQSP